ncbi:zinc knuckle [Cooperia oncophora]
MAPSMISSHKEGRRLDAHISESASREGGNMADVPSAVDELDLGPREESNDVPMAVDEVDVDHREELNELKVCDHALKSLKNVEVLVGAEIAKCWRIGDTKRDSCERVVRSAVNEVERELRDLKQMCAENERERVGFKKLMTSLGCTTQLELVEAVEELAVEAAITKDIEKCTGWARDDVLENCTQLKKRLIKLLEKEKEVVLLQRQLEMARRELDLIRSQKNEPNKGGTKDGLPGWARQAARIEKIDCERIQAILREDAEEARRRSEALSRRSSQESSSLVENQLGAYLKYVALPEVRTFSGKDKDYSWNNFIESFGLKYPTQNWSNEELKTLLKSKLSGQAKVRYEALPKNVKQGPFEGLVAALADAYKVEAQTSRVVALGKLRRLRKSDEQSVAEYCVQLERLSAIAYPELDEGALMTARAQQLYEQVVHWPESVYFLEAMETSGKDAYNNLKEAVLRVERRKLMVECTKDQHEQETETKRRNIKYSRSFRSGSDGAALRKTDRREANSDMREKVTGPTDQSESRVRPIKGQIQCFNCKGRGHMARDCKRGSDVGSKATDVETSTARCTKDMTGQQSGVVSPFGEKSTTKVTVFGKVWPALLDTGSEISILPLKVLQQIESKGRRLREYPVDQNKKILDASGNPMKFRKIVEVPLKEGSEGEIILQMHVSVEKGHLLVLGTNALQALNYTLVRLPNGEDRQGKANVVRGLDKATVCKRAYVAPGELKWVTIKGGARDTERVFHSSCKWIRSGLCTVDEAGVAEIPVWNVSTEPLVLKVRQEVGAWEENEVEYSKVIATEVPTDMLVLGKPTLQAEERKQVLNEYLRSNRELGASDEPELWRLIDELENDYDVDSTMHFLHVRFKCDGQSFPSVDGRPGFDLSRCRCSQKTTVSDLIPSVPPPASAERVQCVLDAARVLAIWWGPGSIMCKAQRIADSSYLALHPKAVAVAYSFFRSRCSHVAIMSGLVPQEARFNHTTLSGWPWDTNRIIQYGWHLSRTMEWSDVSQKIMSANEHSRVVILVPEVLRRLTFCLKGPRTTMFYYRSFHEIKRNNNILFADEVGNVVFVMPPKEPDDSFSWIPFTAAIDLWLSCGAQVWMVNGPRSYDDGSWNRMNEKARSHILGYLNEHAGFVEQWHDLLPEEMGVWRASMACLRVGVVQDHRKWWEAPQALEFYGHLVRQMETHGVQLEPLKMPRSMRAPGGPVPGQSSSGRPPLRDGRISKRHLKRIERRQDRNRQRQIVKGIENMALKNRSEDRSAGAGRHVE